MVFKETPLFIAYRWPLSLLRTRNGVMALSAVCLFFAASGPASAAELLRHPYQDLETVSASTPPPASGPGGSALGGQAGGGATPSAFPWFGETLEYEISWGVIMVGRAWLKIDKVVTIEGRPVYHIISRAKSASFIENFYHVDDINEAWLDPSDMKSFGYYKKLQEGGYFHNEWTLFDMAAKSFYGEKMNKKGEISKFEGFLDGPVNDVLSSLYAVRVMELKPDSSLEIKVNTKKNWAMTVKVLRAEKAKTDYGKFKCYVVEPRVGDEGLFVPKKGKRMFVWLTNDNLRLPLMLKAEIFMGSVTAKLVKRTVE